MQQSSSSTTSAASNQPVPLVNLRQVDVNVVVEVFKVLAKLLGPDFAANIDTEVAENEDATDSKHPFQLTITAAQQHHATLALLKVAAMGSAATGRGVEVPVFSEVKRNGASGEASQLVVLSAEEQNMVGQMDVLAQAAESDAVSNVNPAKRRRVSEEGDSLHAAAKRNDVKAVLNLLRQHHDPYAKDAEGRLPIQLATSKAVWGAFASKMHIVDQKFFPQAVVDGDGVATRLLLAAGANPAIRSSGGLTAFHYAAGEGQADVLEALLDSVANCKYFFELTARPYGSNALEFDELIPLDLACLRGQAGTARVLLERATAVKAHFVRSDGMKPLHFAACSGKVDVVKALLDYGVDVLAVNQNTWSALHFAANLGHSTVCDALLKKNASNLDAQDNAGESALHKAVVALKHKAVKVLVSSGADIYLENHEGFSPCELAREQQDRGILQLLLDSRA
ncbi:hypothetical protein HDU96_009911 [Phlyctochytrium bullatum]|nr:hypothetical protein HDU96_009911 [Phlyctochytrium bullatum]